MRPRFSRWLMFSNAIMGQTRIFFAQSEDLDDDSGGDDHKREDSVKVRFVLKSFTISKPRCP